MSSQLKKVQIKVDGFSMALEYVLWQNDGEDCMYITVTFILAGTYVERRSALTQTSHMPVKVMVSATIHIKSCGVTSFDRTF
jgi:hypothetical protein